MMRRAICGNAVAGVAIWLLATGPNRAVAQMSRALLNLFHRPSQTYQPIGPDYRVESRQPGRGV